MRVSFLLVQPQVRVPHTDSSYLISGLVPGVTYTVEVYAAIGRFQSEADAIEATTGTEESGVTRTADSWNMKHPGIVPVQDSEKDGHAQLKPLNIPG